MRNKLITPMLSLLILAVAPLTKAQQYYNPTVTTGNWSDSVWGPSGGPYDQAWSTNGDAVLAPSAAATITTAGTLNLNTLDLTTNGSVNLSGGAFNLAAGLTWTATANVLNLTLPSVTLGGTQTWTFDGAGIRRGLAGGDINLNGNTLTIDLQSGAQDRTSFSSAFTGAGTLNVDGTMTSSSGFTSASLNNSSLILSLNDSDTQLSLGRGVNIVVGGLSAAGGTITTQSNSTGGTSSGITTDVGAGESYIFGGSIIAEAGTGVINITKSGTGTQVLSGTNSYIGTTTVNAGALVLDGSHTGGGLYTIASGARIGGSGSTEADLTFAAGAQLIFNPLETLTVTGAVAMDNTFSIASLVNVDGTAIDWSAIGVGTYTLLSTTSDFSNIGNFGLANAADLGDGKSAYFQNGSLQLVVVPEPSTLALFGLAGLAVVMGLRRRRK